MSRAVAAQDIRPSRSGHTHQSGVSDVSGARFAEQRAGLMGAGFVEDNHLTPTEQAAELDLFRRAAHLRTDWGRDAGHDAQFQSSPVLRPEAAVVPLCGG